MHTNLILCLLAVLLGLSGCANDTEGQLEDYAQDSAQEAMASNEAESDGDESSLVCRIGLDLDDAYRCRCELTNRDIITEMVLKPIKAAKVDSDPARYVFLGHLSVESNGNVIEDVTLFLPLGRIQRNGTYLKADFSMLQKHLLSWLSNLSDVLQSGE